MYYCIYIYAIYRCGLHHSKKNTMSSVVSNISDFQKVAQLLKNSEQIKPTMESLRAYKKNILTVYSDLGDIIVSLPIFSYVIRRYTAFFLIYQTKKGCDDINSLCFSSTLFSEELVVFAILYPFIPHVTRSRNKVGATVEEFPSVNASASGFTGSVASAWSATTSILDLYQNLLSLISDPQRFQLICRNAFHYCRDMIEYLIDKTGQYLIYPTVTQFFLFVSLTVGVGVVVHERNLIYRSLIYRFKGYSIKIIDRLGKKYLQIGHHVTFYIDMETYEIVWTEPIHLEYDKANGCEETDNAPQSKGVLCYSFVIDQHKYKFWLKEDAHAKFKLETKNITDIHYRKILPYFILFCLCTKHTPRIPYSVYEYNCNEYIGDTIDITERESFIAIMLMEYTVNMGINHE